MYDSAGNGGIESAVKKLTGLVRTNTLSLERRLKKRLPQGHPVMTWLVEYCAWVHNIRAVGEDGKTAFQRVRGRAFARRLLCFGETVHVHYPLTSPEQQRKGALAPRSGVRTTPWPFLGSMRVRAIPKIILKKMIWSILPPLKESMGLVGTILRIFSMAEGASAALSTLAPAED